MVQLEFTISLPSCFMNWYICAKFEMDHNLHVVIHLQAFGWQVPLKHWPIAANMSVFLILASLGTICKCAQTFLMNRHAVVAVSKGGFSICFRSES